MNRNPADYDALVKLGDLYYHGQQFPSAIQNYERALAVLQEYRDRLQTLRLFGIYTSLLTFSFAQVVQYVALNDPRGLTGGSFGFPTVPGLFLRLVNGMLKGRIAPKRFVARYRRRLADARDRACDMRRPVAVDHQPRVTLRDQVRVEMFR